MFGHRHCERSEAIHFAAQRKNGLLPPSLMSYGGQVVASLPGMTVLQSRRLCCLKIESEVRVDFVGWAKATACPSLSAQIGRWARRKCGFVHPTNLRPSR